MSVRKKDRQENKYTFCDNEGTVCTIRAEISHHELVGGYRPDKLASIFHFNSSSFRCEKEKEEVEYDDELNKVKREKSAHVKVNGFHDAVCTRQIPFHHFSQAQVDVAICIIRCLYRERVKDVRGMSLCKL